MSQDLGIIRHTNNTRRFGLIKDPSGHDLTTNLASGSNAEVLSGSERPEVPVEVSRRKGNRRSRKSSSPAVSAAD